MDRRGEAGEEAGFDPNSGAVRGSGSGAGAQGRPGEDHDADSAAGAPEAPAETGGRGHPLPASGEARHGEIPESLEREKGCGDDDRKIVQPAPEAVDPSGEPYRHDDLGRGPGTGNRGE